MKNEIWKKAIIKFLTAQSISLFGSSLVQYAIVWYITLQTSSGKMLTISTICAFFPQIFISLFAGVWIDRYNRKKIIMLSDSIIAIATLLLAIVFMLGNKNMWLLFIVLIIRSLGTGIQTPAVHSVIANIVPKEQLMRINGINSTLSSLIMFLSPAMSGAILSAFSLEVILLIDVVTAVIGVSITASIWIENHQKNNINKPSMLLELKEGYTFLKDNFFVKRLLSFQLIILFCISPSAFLTPLMVNRTFGQEIWRLTASEMTYSIGMVLGGFIITMWGGFKKRLNTTIFAAVLYGVCMFSMGITPFFFIYLILNTIIGVTSPCYSTPITVSIQENVSTYMQGRVFSFMQFTSSCALPFGMIFFGPLSDIFKVQTILIVNGAIVVAISLFAHQAFCFTQSNSEKNKCNQQENN